MCRLVLGIYYMYGDNDDGGGVSTLGGGGEPSMQAPIAPAQRLRWLNSTELWGSRGVIAG